MLKEKNTLNKILLSPAALSILGLAVIVAISIPLAKNASQQYKINKEMEDLEKEIKDLESQNDKLSNLINYLESDQFIDEKARLDLNYKKEGEEVVVIKEKEAPVQGSNSDLLSSLGEKDSRNSINPKKWWNYFFNR